ncbi:MAG TPA: hypothetical protein PLR12_08220, partial [Clostridia bacterium]|nr:hypothetical protein [Clostridia bacterium]
ISGSQFRGNPFVSARGPTGRKNQPASCGAPARACTILDAILASKLNQRQAKRRLFNHNGNVPQIRPRKQTVKFVKNHLICLTCAPESQYNTRVN